MAIDVEVVKDLLLKMGFEKVFMIEKTYNCILLLGKLKEIDMLIGIYTGEISLYAKIIKSEEILEPHWKCDYLEYFPQGLYTFSQSKNLDELVQNIVAKAEVITKRQPHGVGLDRRL